MASYGGANGGYFANSAGGINAVSALLSPKEVIDDIINRNVNRISGGSCSLIERKTIRNLLYEHLSCVIPEGEGISPEIRRKLDPYIQFAISPLPSAYKGRVSQDELEQEVVKIIKMNNPERVIIFDFLYVLMQKQLTDRLSQKIPVLK